MAQPTAQNPSQANTPEPSNNPTLVTLPTEIHLLILHHLDLVSSTCLGLTCKKFYPIHRELHGSVELCPSGSGIHPLLQRRGTSWSIPLSYFLREWAAPAGLIYDILTKKFIDEEEMIRRLKSRAGWHTIKNYTAREA